MKSVTEKFQPIWSFSKSFLQDLCSEKRFQFFLLIISIFVVGAHTAMMGGLIHSVTETQGIVGAGDNDAGIGIDTAIKTQLINNNGFTAYGPSYYRAARTLDMFLHLGNFADGTGSRESTERSLHFLLMLTSYFSLLGLCFVISYILFQAWPLRLLSTITMTASFLRDEVWSDMVVRVHPDHLLGFAIAVAVLMTWKSYLEPQNRKKFIFATAAWGLVMTVKMTVILFAPVIALLLLPLSPERKFRNLWTRGWLIVGCMALCYFVFAFPQSLDFLRVLGFLREQKNSVIAGNWEYFVKWVLLFKDQLAQPILALLLLCLLVPTQPRAFAKDFRWSQWSLLLTTILISTLYLMSRRVLSPWAWYPIPFIAALFVPLALAAAKISNHLETLYPQKIRNLRSYTLYAFAVFVGMSYLRPVIPEAVHRSIAGQQHCRPEARIVEAKVDAVAEKGGGVLADPYIPYLRKYHDKEIRMAWEMSTDLIKPGFTNMIALRSDYYARYLPTEKDVGNVAYLYIQDWNKTQSFYMLFHNKESARDPYGQDWKRTYTDSCSYELWERVLK